MLAHEPAPAELRELACDELGRALEARAVPDPTDSERRREVRVLFRAQPLGAALEALRDAPGVELTTAPGGRLMRLRCPRTALEALGHRFTGPRHLLAAHDLATAPPPVPRLMGILNVTPDSFSDGGAHAGAGAAVEHGLKLLSEGAEILDVGGESTRPGAAAVPAAVEIERVLPVIAGLARSTDARICIDTTKAEVAAAALDAGASIVNDVSAGRRDPAMFELIARNEADVILMHMRGTPRTMQEAPTYEDVVREVCEHLRERAASGLKAGIAPSRIAVDPGIGFGKRLKDNLDLIRALPQLRSLGLPIVLGVSRKSFLGTLSGEDRPDRRGAETLAATTAGCLLGADVHRVHDVAQARAALSVAAALRPTPHEEPEG